jgi:hypothetical protein
MVVTSIHSGGFDGSLMHHARQRIEPKRSARRERRERETRTEVLHSDAKPETDRRRREDCGRWGCSPPHRKELGRRVCTPPSRERSYWHQSALKPRPALHGRLRPCTHTRRTKEERAQQQRSTGSRGKGASAAEHARHLSAGAGSAAVETRHRTNRDRERRTEKGPAQNSTKSDRRQNESLSNFAHIKFNLARTHPREIIVWD